MNLKISLTILLLSLNLVSFSQQKNNWYFGGMAGITFSTTPPSALTNSIMVADEGNSSISDRQGNILFYTNGLEVYNRNHIIMPNGTGLMGNSSSTQSALIVPKPGDTTRYFIFTADASENNLANGYRYSEVDMTLNGGLGDITAAKNVLIFAPCTERITAIKQPNGIDYWIITKELNNNRFRVYQLGCGGLNPVPIISDAGVTHPQSVFLSDQGQLKVSPDGKKLAVVIAGLHLVQLFDFDNNTGIISNPKDITGFQVDLASVYGTEFSPNSNVLYISHRNSQTINQYDISSNNQAAINSSRVIINAMNMPFSLQTGPDGKIYIANLGNTSISVINNPDNYGSGYNYTPNTISLAGRPGNKGLPGFATGFDVNPPWSASFTSTFINCYVQFNGVSNIIGTVKWYWNFGDGIIDSGQVVNHSYRSSGTYNVRLKVVQFTGCGIRYDSIIVTNPVTINNVFAVDYSSSGSCINQPYQFNDNTVLTVGSITGYNWEFGDGNSSTQQNPAHTYTSPGTYTVKLVVSTSGVCRADSITKTVFVDTRPVVDFNFIDGCKDSTIQFTNTSTNATGGISQWSWSFGNGNTSTVQTPNNIYSAPGNFNITLTATSQNGCSGSLTKPISIESTPVADFSFNTVCLNRQISFTDNSTNNSGSIINWQWNFGENSVSALQNPVHSYTSEGDFPVALVVSTQNGCTSLSHSETLIVRQAIANAGRDTIAVYNQPIQLNGSGGSVYQWSPSAFLNNASIANPVAILTNDQVFTLNITTPQGCMGTDKVSVAVVKTFDIYVPSGFTPNGDGKNELLQPYSVGIREMEYFKVFNRWGQMVFSSKNPGDGWNGKFNGVNQPTGVYVWIINAIDISGKQIVRKGTSVLIR